MLTSWLKKPVWPFSGTREKTIDLRFSLPSIEPNAPVPQFTSARFAKEVEALGANPSEQCKLLRREIRSLNRCNIGPGERMERTKQALALFYPLLQGALRDYSKAGGVPDQTARQETLDTMAEILGMLRQSYTAVFKAHYEKSDAYFTRAIEQIRVCACRILEMVKLEQRVRALRYQPLNGSAWYITNTVFHIMRAYDDVDAPVPPLEAELLPAHAGRLTTLKANFAAIHMTGRLDMLHWPVPFQSLLVGYLDGAMDLVSVIDDHREALGKEQMLVYCHDETLGGVQRQKGPQRPAVVLIDWSALAARLRDDCVNIVKSSRNNQTGMTPKKFLLLSNIDRLAMAQQLLSSMQTFEHAETSDEREQAVTGMQIYVDFREVYLLCGHIISGRAGTMGKRFIDHFAERSSMIADGQGGDPETLWYVLRQTKTLIRLKTKETIYSTAMEVGSLVAYGLGEQDKHRPRLAVVRRIYRPNSTYVIIDLERLAKYAEPVTLAPTVHGKPVDEVMHGMLVFDPDLGVNLLLSPKANIMDKTTVQMTFRGKAYDFVMSNLKYVTGGFYLFGMPLSMSQLGLDAPPQFPDPSDALAKPEWH